MNAAEYPDTVAIVLAAGSSSRLGQPKQLLELDGETMLARTARLAHEAGVASVYVVLGYQPEDMTAALRHSNACLVFNRDWKSGMGSSIGSGVAAVIAESSHAKNILLLVCDQPGLKLPLLQTLLRVHCGQQRALSASRYGGKLGVPAVFREEFFDRLLSCSGDSGARDLIRTHAAAAGVVDFPAGESDLDTAEDIAVLLKR